MELRDPVYIGLISLPISSMIDSNWEYLPKFPGEAVFVEDPGSDVGDCTVVGAILDEELDGVNVTGDKHAAISSLKRWLFCDEDAAQRADADADADDADADADVDGFWCLFVDVNDVDDVNGIGTGAEALAVAAATAAAALKDEFKADWYCNWFNICKARS